ncbi:unnamed protein product [Cylindrotheca closterium]|uniref:PPM-type phosphatase domain-containing protein n=1 Tax=Cylindrotheca closterium TaxID=2856 RepID=A0AAD2FI31_9STRA|nr:unnamed protein product [Cylindrotheca closterium]
MLARWFDRDGIGQYLAPDENAAKQVVKEEARATFWQIVAPDPKFSERQAPPQDAFAMLPGSPNQIRCMHCHRWTDISKGAGSENKGETPGKVPETPKQTSANSFTTPKKQYKTPKDKIDEEINALVLSAAKETAASMTSPSHIREARDKIFRICGCQKPISDKITKRLRNSFKKNPKLLSSRSTHLGQLVPDGYTPLMACAHAGNGIAGAVVLEMAPKGCIWETDLQGRTALHIAAETGNVDMIDLLIPKLIQANGMKSPPPVDILGRTPFGTAVTSPNPTAKKRRKELESALFSPGDLSVFGHAKSETERGGQCPELQIAYGMADMPGMRVQMEDAVCCETWKQSGKSYCVLAVCDGHGDRGSVSQFVADNLVTVLKPHIDDMESTWQEKFEKACLTVDANLKDEGIPGGSTAVIALTTESEIIVANVGDSRAILIQSSGTNLEAKMEKLALDGSKDTDAPPLQQEGEKTGESSENEKSVIGLSEDHKPNLPEEQARIEAAGMKVNAVIFQEDGKEVTIHKVALSEKDQLAVSRAFGDFEYKLNTSLPPEEQAVVAVPEVRVHKRDPDRDLYLVLACDGVFDVLDNKQVMKFVLDQVSVRKEITDTVLPEVGDALLRESLNAGSKDNMTVVVAALSKESTGIKTIIQGRTLDFTSPDVVQG